MTSSTFAPVCLSSFRFVLLCVVLCAPFVATGSAEVNPTPVTIVSAASFESVPVAADSIAAAFGAKLATATVSATDLDPNAPGIQLPEQLAGTSVRVNGQLAKLLFVSPEQVNFIIPTNPVRGTATVRIIAGDGTESTGTIAIGKILPAIFTANADGTGILAANVVRVRNGVRMPDESLIQFDPVTRRYIAKPLDLGPPSDRVFLELYCTGIRGAEDRNQDGNLQESVWVLLGGQVITPTFAGRQPNFAGLDQVNFEVPRNLPSNGKLRLGIQAQAFVSESLEPVANSSKPVELELAALSGATPPIITEFSPATVSPGQSLTITGQGFSLVPEENVVKIGSAIASIEFASAARLVVRVPYGAASGKVKVKTPNGEAASNVNIAVRTSISGSVELVDGVRWAGQYFPFSYPHPGSSYTLKNILVRLVGTNLTARTNEHGVFYLPDVPAGLSYLEVDANITQSTMQFPKLKIQVPVTAGQDNLIPGPIMLQPSNGAALGDVDPSTGKIIQFSSRVELAAGTAVQYADGTTQRDLATTRIFQLPEATPFTPLSLFPGHFPAVLQVTPFDATFTPSAKLVLALDGDVPRHPYLKVYHYDLTPGSATFGTLIEMKGGGLNNNIFPPTFEVPIKETGYYVVVISPPDISPVVFNYGRASLGTVRGSDGKTPISNAFVTSNFSLFDPTPTRVSQRTDESGSYILRSGDFFGLSEAYIRAVQPDGTVFRALATTKEDPNNDLTRFPPVSLDKLEMSSFSATNMVLLPDAIQMSVNEQRWENFLVLDAQQVQQVAVSGAPFASLLPSGGGSYTLRLAPKATDFGYFNLLVTATDTKGNVITRYVRVLVTAPNKPPVITIPQNEYRVKVGETLSFPVTATDTDTGQTVALFLGREKPLAEAGNPVDITYSFTPPHESVGLVPLTFSAVDNGFGKLLTEKTIVIRVEGVTKPNEWSLISNRGLIGLLTDTEVYGEPISIDSSGSASNYIGGILYRSVFGEGVSYSTDKGVTWANSAGLSVKKDIEFVGQVVGSDKLLMVEVGSTLNNRIYVSTNQGKDWTLFLSYTGGQNVLAGDSRGNLLVRGSDGQIYKAVLEGTTIKLIPTNLSPSSDFKLIAAEGTKLYVAVNRPDTSDDKIFFSSDGGVNWADVTAKFPGGDYKTIHVIGPRIFARTEKGVYLSMDEGMTWSLMTGLPNNASAQYFASNTKYVFALFSDGKVYAYPLP